MCQMTTRIGRIGRRQSWLGGFVPSPSPELAKESFSSDGRDDVVDAFGLKYDDKMMTS